MEYCGELDLASVPSSRRIQTWRTGIQQFFPGCGLKEIEDRPTIATAKGVSLGPAQLWQMISPRQTVSIRAGGPMSEIFSIVAQCKGQTIAHQCNTVSHIAAGGVFLVDGHNELQVEFTAAQSVQVLLHIPRRIVLDQYPLLRERNLFLPASDPTGSLIYSMMMGLSGVAGQLTESQSRKALGAVLKLLDLPQPMQTMDGNAWRVQRALDDIGQRYREPDYDAFAVAAAQRISRRHLDNILIRATGKSIDHHIWDRRLKEAAEILSDRDGNHRQVSKIAFALGFRDPAHFCRKFKAEFGLTPSQWSQA